VVVWVFYIVFPNFNILRFAWGTAAGERVGCELSSKLFAGANFIVPGVAFGCALVFSLAWCDALFFMGEQIDNRGSSALCALQVVGGDFPWRISIPDVRAPGILHDFKPGI